MDYTVKVRATTPTAAVTLTFHGTGEPPAPRLGSTIKVVHPTTGVIDAVVHHVQLNTAEPACDCDAGTAAYVHAEGCPARPVPLPDPPAAKPVSGAAISAEAAKPGYRAHELRERAMEAAVRKLGLDQAAIDQANRELDPWKVERVYRRPSKEGVGEVQVRVGEPALGSRVFVTDSDLYLRCGGQAAFAQLIDPGKTGKWSSAVSLLARTDACSVTLEAAGVREGLSGYTPADFAAKFPNLATCAALKAIALAWTYAGGQEMPPQVQRYDELATYWLEMLGARRKCGAAPRDLPENMGPLPAGCQVPDRYVELDTWPWPAVRAAIKLIDPAQVRISMDRDQLTVSGPLCASAKADPEAAFRSLPDLRPAP